MENDYRAFTIRGLHNIAKNRGLRGYSRLSKEQLIEVLRGQRAISDINYIRGPVNDLSRQTIRGLHDIAKNSGLRGYSRLSKRQLIEVLRGQRAISDINYIRGPVNDLSRQTIRGLHDIAKNSGLRGYSRLSKEQLIEVLRGQRQLVNEPRKRAIREQRQPVRRQTIRDLQNIAKNKGLKGYSRLSKEQLNQVLRGQRAISDINCIREPVNDLSRQTIRGLQNIAKNEGRRGYSRLRKEQLIERLKSQEAEDRRITVKELREAVKSRGLRGYSRLRRAELLKLLMGIQAQKLEVKLAKTALNDQIRIYKGEAPPWNGITPFNNSITRTIAIMNEFLLLMRERVIKILSDNRGRKVKMNIEAYMYYIDASPVLAKPARFHSEINSKETDLYELYDRMAARIKENLEKFASMGSGGLIRNISEIVLSTSVYDPLKAEGYIPLPEWIEKKKVVINMQNKDDKCFLWCILRWLNPVDRQAYRVDKILKEKENSLKMDGIEYPVSFKDIDKFEKQNPEISVNVFEYASKKKINRIRAPKKIR